MDNKGKAGPEMAAVPAGKAAPDAFREGPEASGARVVQRTFDILELLAEARQPLGLALIAQSLDLSKSTVHRLLQCLCDRGYAVKTESRDYSIGAKLLEIASFHINSLELQTEAKPYLSALYADLNLTVHMGVLEGTEIVYVEKLDQYPLTKNSFQVGYRSPAYCSSIGKCLMAALSGDELEELLYNCRFQQFTPNTITNLYEMKKHLRQVRQQGWAMDDEEYLAGHRCVGAPVYDYRGTVIASLSASGDITQITDQRVPSIIRQVRKTAAEVSRAMGYTE